MLLQKTRNYSTLQTYLPNSDGHWKCIEVFVECDQHARLHCSNQAVDHVV